METATRWRHPGEERSSWGGPQQGLGLIEVVIAVGLLITLAVGVVQLFALSAQSVVRVRHRTSSLALAVGKLEQLRAGVATGKSAGGPTETGGANREYFDPDSRLVGTGRTPPPGSRYVRSWSVARLPRLRDVLVARVVVAPTGPDAGRGGTGWVLTPDAVRLVTLLPSPTTP